MSSSTQCADCRHAIAPVVGAKHPFGCNALEGNWPGRTPLVTTLESVLVVLAARGECPSAEARATAPAPA